MFHTYDVGETFQSQMSPHPSVLLFISSKENVHRHTLRLLNHLHQKVHSPSMEALMKTLEPPKQVFKYTKLSQDPVSATITESGIYIKY